MLCAIEIGIVFIIGVVIILLKHMHAIEQASKFCSYQLAALAYYNG